ncbi:MAG: COG4223 family protein [Pseudolabrys sp.]
MADKRKAPQGPDARKRKAPTIDLTATDVTPPPQPAAAEPLHEPEPPVQPEPLAAAPFERPPEPPPSEPPQAPPPNDPPRASAEPENPRVGPAAQGRSATSIASMLLAGVAGGVIVAAALGGAWYAGLMPANRPVRSDMVPKQQIVALQNDVDALKARPAPTVDTKVTDALTQRVAQLEAALKDLPKSGGADPQLAQKLAELQSTITPLTQRLSSAESAIKSGDTAVAALGKRIDDIAGNASQARTDADAASKTVTQLDSQVKDLARNQASTVTRADIDAVQQKLSSLEQAEQAARASIKQSTAATSATRLALASQALRNAVTSGTPYQAELAQAKALGGDAAKLAALEPFASSGVPSTAMLAQQLRAMVPQMQKIAAPRAQPTGSFFEKLQANAGNLVRISPANAPSGDQPADVLARLEIEAAHNDIAAAAADIRKLPDAAQAPAKDWLARVTARQAALTAADDIAASSARALTQGAQ